MSAPARARSKAAIRRENRQLRDAAARATELAHVEEISAKAVAKAWWPQWATALLAAVVSLLIAGGSAAVALSVSRSDAKRDQAKEIRERRTQVYADYLVKARAYTEVQLDLNRASRIAEFESKNTAAAASVAASAKEQALADKSRIAAAAFYMQADLVYVYGSDEAWNAHKGIESAVLPDYRPDAPALINPGRMDVAMQAFQSVFCREASPQPRSGCG